MALTGGCYDTAKRRTNGVPRHSVNGVSPKFKQMAKLYEHFAKGWTGLDFSDEALLEMFNNESYGTSIVDKKKNGYYVGKQWMGVAISMWKEDRARGHLYLNELYECPTFPHWWLDSVFGVKYEYKSHQQILDEYRRNGTFHSDV